MKPFFRDGILIETQVTAMAPTWRKNYKYGCTLRLVGPAVTCYFRHLGQVFGRAGIEVTSQNRREIDTIIQEVVGVNYKNCPAAWKQVKTHVLEDEAGFVSLLKGAWENRKKTGLR
jgi:hypothetical protein